MSNKHHHHDHLIEEINHEAQKEVEREERYAKEHGHPHVDILEPQPRWKKTVLILGCLFIVFLMVSWVVVTYPIGNILAGRMESKEIFQDRVWDDHAVVIFENESFAYLQKWYYAQQKFEFAACFKGTIEDERGKSVYHVTSLYEPQIYSRSFSEVQFQACDQDTIIMMHTHPYKHCIASDTDFNTLHSMQATNPSLLGIVMCEPYRMTLYR